MTCMFNIKSVHRGKNDYKSCVVIKSISVLKHFFNINKWFLVIITRCGKIPHLGSIRMINDIFQLCRYQQSKTSQHVITIFFPITVSWFNQASSSYFVDQYQKVQGYSRIPAVNTISICILTTIVISRVIRLQCLSHYLRCLIWPQ